tara:strand:+ start:227 stop:550 length:324 start_codon:yes stop_codon:yes gene_type:complete
MSQHLYTSQTAKGEPVQVLAGWDRPLGHFFLVIERLSEQTAEEEHFLYSNLDDPDGGFSQVESFAYFNEVLTTFGIAVPDAMIDAVEKDKAECVGNRVRDWTQENGQ